MAESKQLKIKECYLDTPTMQRLRKCAGGEVFTIIYLKLRLLSLKTGGVIAFNDCEGSFVDEIAHTFGEQVEDVGNALAVLRRYGLIDEITTEKAKGGACNG